MSEKIAEEAFLHWMPFDQTPDDLLFRLKLMDGGARFKSLQEAVNEAKRAGPEKFRVDKALPWIKQGETLLSTMEIGFLTQS